MKNIRSKLILIVLIMFSFTFLLSIDKTKAIYRETESTTINLTVTSSNGFTVIFDANGGTFDSNYGGGSTYTITRNNNETVGTLPTATLANNNFLGWFVTENGEDRKINGGEVITGTVTFTAHWKKIICKKVTNVNNLNTETCAGANGCATSGTGYSTSSPNNVITYGTIFGNDSPIAGDAYDCDIDADDIYDETDGYGKHIARFYFVREKHNQGSEDTAVLIYYTSYDSNGRVDSQNTIPDTNIGSDHYTAASGWLPTSSTVAGANTLAWSHTGLIDFDGNNGKITRFLSVDDLETVCGTINKTATGTTPNESAAYFTACFNNPNASGPNWYMMENSRFQSSSLGRAGIWLEYDSASNKYYRIQTGSLNINHFDSGNDSNNMARPVIEIPMSALDGYDDRDQYKIEFETYGAGTIPDMWIYENDTLGQLPTPTKEFHDFDGWYASYSNGTYSNPVTSSTVVTGAMTLHAKWTKRPTNFVTFYANGQGATIDGQTSVTIEIETGDSFDTLPTPTWTGENFVGWYKDNNTYQVQFTTSDTVNSDFSVYAKWDIVDYVAQVGSTRYDTLAKAIEAVPKTSTKTRVTVLKDITLQETITISSDRWVELNLQNYTLDTNSCTLITNNGKLDIINGTLKSTHSGTGDYIGYVILNSSSGTVNISGGLLKYDNSTATEAKVISSRGTVNISGGKLECNAVAATIDNKGSSVINVTGGEIVATNTTGKGQAIYLEGTSSANISGDSIISNKSHATTNPRAAVDNYGTGTVTITGGTITSENAYAVANRKGGSTYIGINDTNGNVIDNTTPVLKGNKYALLRSDGNIYVYDGVYKGITGAASGTINKPSGFDFVQNGTESSHKIYYLAENSGGSYTVTFDADNGSTIPPVTGISRFGTVGANMPNDPTKTNYIFEKWFVYKETTVNNNTVVEYSGEFTSSTPITSDVTVKAKWKPTIGTATISQSIAVNVNDTATISITGPDGMEDYTCTSDNTSIATVSNCVVTGVAAGSTSIRVTGTLSGDYVTVPVTVSELVQNCTVTFNSNGGAFVPSETVTCGSTLGANMPQDPIRTDYGFVNWTIHNSNTVFTSSTVIDDNMTVDANWVPSISQATITSSLSIEEGSTGTISITNAPVDMETYTVVSNDTSVATVSGLTVTGVDAGSTTITITGDKSGDTHTVTVSVTAPQCTVTFNSNGGALVPSETVTCGTTLGANMPQDPIRTDYGFVNWTIHNSNTVFTSSTLINNDMTVDANWVPSISQATISSSLMIGMGDTGTISITNAPVDMETYTVVSNDTSIATVNGATVTGVDVGSTTVTITGDKSGDTHTVNITITTQSSYTITFDPNNGSSATSYTVPVGSTLESYIPTQPTNGSYIFDNWYLYDTVNDDFTLNVIDKNDIVAENRTYKVSWADSNKVCKIGRTYFNTIQNAIDSISTTDKTTISLLKDVSSNMSGNDISFINLNTSAYATLNIVFDLQGHSLSYTGGQKVYVIRTKAKIEITGNGAIYSNSAGAGAITIEPGGGLVMNDGSITATGNRHAIYNNGGIVEIGGTASFSSQTFDAWQGVPRATVANVSGTMTITGGTFINTYSGTGGGSAISTGNNNLTIGTNDGTIDTTTIVAQGTKYGLEVVSGKKAKVYDGMFKGIEGGISDTSCTTIPTGWSFNTLGEETISSDTYHLAYLVDTVVTPTPTATPTPTPTPTPTATPTPTPTPTPATNYTVTFESVGGTISPTSVTVTGGTAITSNDLPSTTTWGVKTFSGWYTDEDFTNAVVPGTTTVNSNVTYYAKWVYTPASAKVTYDSTNEAMGVYFNNISTWKNLSESDFNTAMSGNFTAKGCSDCNAANNCDSPLSGNYCDKPKVYDTQTSTALKVYLYDETNHVIGKEVNYANASTGTITNLIPGQVYYWEDASDPSVNGLIEATTQRRALDAGNIRNVRDLGGLSVSYTENNVQKTGTIKYGRLIRGAKLTSNSADATSLTNLGITREIDLRPDSERGGAVRLSAFDNDTGDIIIHNYLINNTAYTYSFLDKNDNQQTTVVAHTSYASELKSALKTTMQYIVSGDNIYFHCTIGTDRTGTLAYFLEGLLGVAEEDRVEDYELTYFFGLTNRTRYHDHLSGSDINPRFTFMHVTYPSNQDIYNWYTTVDPESNDVSLLTSFRNAMINFNS